MRSLLRVHVAGWLVAFTASAVSAQGNAPAFPAQKFTTWRIAGTDEPLATIGDSARFVLTTSNMYQRVGNLWHLLDRTIEQGWQASWSWPGGKTTYVRRTNIQERYGTVSRKQGLMVATRNWVPPSDADSAKLSGYVDARALVPQPYLVQHVFRGIGSWGGVGALDAAQVQRWLPPQVIVDGIVTNDQTDIYGANPGSPLAGNGPATFGSVRGVLDAALPSHRAVYNLFRFQMGVDIRQTVHAYAINGGIDSDYLLYDYSFINTGTMSRRPIQAHMRQLDDFWFSLNFHARPADPDMVLGNSADDVLEWFEPWPAYTTGTGVGHQMVMFYDGDKTGAPEDWGGPGYSEAAQMGYDLWAKQYTAVGWLFAETAPGSGSDDPAQPQGTNWCRERDFNLGMLLGNDMTKQYRTIFCSGVPRNPTTLTDDVPRRHPNGILDQTNAAMTNISDPTPYQGLHWATLPSSAEVHAVMVVAAGGLDARYARELAKTQCRRRDAAQSPVQTPAEIALIQTGRDSVRRTLDRAFWNVYGYDPNGTRWANKPAALNQAFNVPDPPSPPAAAWMESGADRITITWTPLTYQQQKDPDTGVSDFAGYRVYRAIMSSDSDFVLVYQGTGTEFVDVAVSKDFGYYYYVTAYDDGTQNWSSPGARLESGKFWLWNGWNDMAVRPAATRSRAWTSGMPMPTARSEHAAVGLGGKLYAIGGTTSSTWTNIVEIYDPATNAWESGAPMPTARRRLAAVPIGGKIYAVGGSVFPGGYATNTLEIYDPATNTWTTGAPMPTPRYDLAAATIGGKLYVVGGYRYLYQYPLPTIATPVSTLEIYDPATDTWTTGDSLSAARYYLVAAAIDGKLWAIGGSGSTGVTPGMVEIYDPVTNTWAPGDSVRDGRNPFAGAVIDGRIYLITYPNLLDIRDPAAGAWAVGAPMPSIRGQFGVAAVDDKLYVVGGSSGGEQLRTLQIYSPANDAPAAIRSIGSTRLFSLSQNAPNPFNPSTTIRYYLAQVGDVRLAVYDVNGRLVRTLVSGPRPAGSHEAVWDGRDAAGRSCASGVYIYRLVSSQGTIARRMALVR